MKKFLAATLGVVGLAVVCTIAFPAPRALAQGVLSVVVGLTGAAVPTNALQVGGVGFNNTLRAPRYCDKVAQVNATIGAGVATAQVVGLVAAQNIYVCGYQLGASTAVAGTALTWVEGTGAACATGQTTVMNPILTTPTSAPTTPNMVLGPIDEGLPFTLTAGDALCLKQASTTNASTVTGWLAYTQNP